MQPDTLPAPSTKSLSHRFTSRDTKSEYLAIHQRTVLMRFPEDPLTPVASHRFTFRRVQEHDGKLHLVKRIRGLKKSRRVRFRREMKAMQADGLSPVEAARAMAQKWGGARA